MRHTLRLVYLPTLGLRIISTDPDVPNEAVTDLNTGIERLAERSNGEVAIYIARADTDNDPFPHGG